MKSRPLDNSQPTRLKNKRCADCQAEFLRADEPQKAHVIPARFQVEGMIGNANITFTLQAPPQADDERIFRLACYQLQGFHFFLTYDHIGQQGYRWKGSIAPLGVVRRSDWGNPPHP